MSGISEKQLEQEVKEWRKWSKDWGLFSEVDEHKAADYKYYITHVLCLHSDWCMHMWKRRCQPLQNEKKHFINFTTSENTEKQSVCSQG